MKAFLEKANRFFDRPLDLRSRAIVLVASLVCLVPTNFLPMWEMEMYAPQYRDGLRLSIHSWKFEAGNNGNDLNEINTLNHYIGMKALDPRDFAEFEWLPLAIGIFVLLGLRAAVLGKAVALVDLFVLFIYFGAFSLASFVHRLYLYGHNLDPMAPMKVEPFTPPIIGHKALANFDVYSFPGIGSWFLGAYPLFLALALFLSWRSGRREPPVPEAGTRAPGGGGGTA